MRLKIAVRNLSRHRLRSFLSATMVAFSVSAIIIFKGFTDYNIFALSRVVGDQQYGHIQIAKKEYWYPTSVARAPKLLENPDEIISALKGVEGITAISGRISYYGLISNGYNSTGAMIVGFDPIKEEKFSKTIFIEKGTFLSKPPGQETIIGTPLAKNLGVQTGDSITIVGNTFDNVINAADLKVTGFYRTGLDEVDSRVVYVPIDVAQSLLDTKKLDLLTIRTTDFKKVDQIISKIKPIIQKISDKLEVRPWYELSELFKKVESFYRVQNTVIESIILMLVLLAISNIVGVTIVERTGEIGTVRSMGETRSDLIKQFLMESTLLGIMGSVAGFALATILILSINNSNLTMEVPGASLPIPITIHFVPFAFVYSAILGITTTVLATLFPAYRSTKMNIVDALRKNI